ncbi:MAG: hypothetical protein ACJ74U_06985 [Jatrophihabitantaceae bacterium]
MTSPAVLGALQDARLLPDDTLAVLLVGSQARSWEHEASDIDVIVATEHTPEARTFPLVRSRAGDHLVGAMTEFADRRLEVHYWSQPQVDALLAAASWEVFDEAESSAEPFGVKERQFADRLSTGRVLTGDRWQQVCRTALHDSAFRSLCIQFALDSADGVLVKALGLLRSGDIHAAVLAAKDAFDHAVDALLLGGGELGPLRKWRARRFHSAAAALPIDFDTYWTLETMQHFDPNDQGRWVDQVAAFVHTTALYTELDPRPGHYLEPADAAGDAWPIPLDRYPRWRSGVRPRRVRDGLLLLTGTEGILLDGPRDRMVCRADGRHTVAEIVAATAAELRLPEPDMAAAAGELFGCLEAEGYVELTGEAL